jgi:hypothetical protein
MSEDVGRLLASAKALAGRIPDGDPAQAAADLVRDLEVLAHRVASMH